jgi:hypothetical protein
MDVSPSDSWWSHKNTSYRYGILRGSLALHYGESGLYLFAGAMKSEKEKPWSFVEPTLRLNAKHLDLRMGLNFSNHPNKTRWFASLDVGEFFLN